MAFRKRFIARKPQSIKLDWYGTHRDLHQMRSVEQSTTYIFILFHILITFQLWQFIRSPDPLYPSDVHLLLISFCCCPAGSSKVQLSRSESVTGSDTPMGKERLKGRISTASGDSIINQVDLSHQFY